MCRKLLLYLKVFRFTTLTAGREKVARVAPGHDIHSGLPTKRRLLVLQTMGRRAVTIGYCVHSALKVSISLLATTEVALTISSGNMVFKGLRYLVSDICETSG
jgi:hypothetical protein